MRWTVLFVGILAVYQFSLVDSSNSEADAGRAISKLLQEKISKKFKEAANEVKGVLVKHLGDSLKSAHNKMNPEKKKKLVKALKVVNKAKENTSTSRVPSVENKRTTPNDEECRFKKLSHRSKCHACKTHFVRSWHRGASAHMNKAGRHRKNSGPPVPPKPNAQQTGPFGMPLPGQPNPQPGPQQPPPQPQQAGASLQRPGAPQCGGQCPSSCAPTCDNTCCQMVMQSPGACPTPCSNHCYSYCPQQCCPHGKRDAILLHSSRD